MSTTALRLVLLTAHAFRPPDSPPAAAARSNHTLLVQQEGRSLYLKLQIAKAPYVVLRGPGRISSSRREGPKPHSVSLKMDNASSHVKEALKDPKLHRLCKNTRGGTRARVELVLQPANPPDANANDAAFYRSLHCQCILGENRSKAIPPFIKEVKLAFWNYPPATMDRV